MTPFVTIVTPVAPYHTDLLERCKASVAAQTVDCIHIVVHDVEGRGAGWGRNQGLRQVETPFVVFLDADDQIEPTFLEECLNAYDEQTYVYTDWIQDTQVVDAPECVWKGKAWHCVTALLPTTWVKHINGFDENLTAGEDTHFYMKLTRGGMCGKRLARPLFRYGREGRRSKDFPNSLAYHALMKRLSDEFGGKTMPEECGGCGGTNLVLPDQPVNEQQPGMVLAKAVYDGNRRERGRITGTLYPRTGNGKQVWVYPEDAHAEPTKFQIVRPSLPTAPSAPPRPTIVPKLPILVPEPESVQPLHGAAEVAGYVNENSAPVDQTPQALPVAAEIVGEVAPNVSKVLAKAKRAGSKRS